MTCFRFYIPRLFANVLLPGLMLILFATVNTLAQSDAHNLWHRALYLNGDSDRIISTKPIDLLGSHNDLTVMFWINPDSVQHDLATVFEYNAFGPMNFTIHRKQIPNSLNFYFVYHDGSNYQGGKSFRLESGQWQHVAIVKQGKLLTFYLNGQQDGLAFRTRNSYIQNVPSHIGIGNSPALELNRPFRGALDELRIWNRALTDQERLQQMVTTPSIEDSTLIACWNFDDDNQDQSHNRIEMTTLGTASQRSPVPAGEQGAFMKPGQSMSFGEHGTASLVKVEGPTNDTNYMMTWFERSTPHSGERFPASFTGRRPGVWGTRNFGEATAVLTFYMDQDHLKRLGLLKRSDATDPQWEEALPYAVDTITGCISVLAASQAEYSIGIRGAAPYLNLLWPIHQGKYTTHETTALRWDGNCDQYQVTLTEVNEQRGVTRITKQHALAIATLTPGKTYQWQVEGYVGSDTINSHEQQFSVVAATGDVRINEFLTANTELFTDPDFFANADWVELYNNETFPVDLAGWFLSDDDANPTKWAIPASTIIAPKGHLLFWADGLKWRYHTNFKLSSDRESLVLATPDGTVQDSVAFSGQQTNLSMGRQPDGADRWLYFSQPTPGKANRTTGWPHQVRSAPPAFSKPGGVYDKPQVVALSADDGSDIRFTLDCNTPGLASFKYSGSGPIDQFAIVRARTYSDSLHPSETVTNLYMIGQKHQLPIVSIVTDLPNIIDSTFGFYNHADIEMERPVHVQFIDTNGRIGFENTMGIQLSGFTIKHFAQKSMSLNCRNKYGDPQINYRIFADKDISRFSGLILRNSGNDWVETMIRDGMMQSLVRGHMNIDYQASRPCVVYLNGQYWGIYNIREKINEDYLAGNHGVDPDNVDLLEPELRGHQYLVLEGDDEHYNHLVSYIESHDMKDKGVYEYIGTQVDLDEFIDYYIAEIYFANKDWPGTNVKMWRPRHQQGRWRWVLFDLDFGFGFAPDVYQEYRENMIKMVTDENGYDWPNPPFSTFLFRSLLKNAEFQQEFIQRFNSYLNTLFLPDRVIRHIDSCKAIISKEMPRQLERWHNIQSRTIWEGHIARMKKFARQRPAYVRQHLTETFKLSSLVKLQLQADLPGGGFLHVNHVPVTDSLFIGKYYTLLPVTIEAIPNPGFEFAGWKEIDMLNKTQLKLALKQETILTAVFRPSGNHILPTRISSDLYLDDTVNVYLALTDVTIDTNATVTIGPGVTIQAGQNVSIMVHGRLMANGTQQHPVKLQPITGARINRWGALCFDHSQNTSVLSHILLEGASMNRANPDIYKAAISGHHCRLELHHIMAKNLWAQPVYCTYSDVKMTHCDMNITVTGDVVNIKYGRAHIEGCTFTGNDSPDTDAIDYDQITDGVIRNNKIYNFRGVNSDGIDLGEGCSNVLVEGNYIFNCTDKGISVGQRSTCRAIRNLIVGCNQGIGVKDSFSFALADRCTFYDNNYAVNCFEKNAHMGGGRAEVINSILCTSRKSHVYADEKSAIHVAWSASDKVLLPGDNNQLLAQHPYINPATHDFKYIGKSPLSNAGYKKSEKDPDGSRADIGYQDRPYGEKSHQITISQLHNCPNKESGTGDWVELHNASSASVDISGWSLQNQTIINRFTFPAGTVIHAGGHLMVCQDTLQAKPIARKGVGLIGNTYFNIGRKQDPFVLFDDRMRVVYATRYEK